MKIEDIRIVIDERERKSGIPKLLKAIGVNVELKTLPIGDYIVSPETVVERKSIHDLMSSIFDGRLFDQCNRLKDHFQFPIILLEGDVDEIESITENPLVFYGALSTVAIDFKIPIIPTPNASHTAKLLISLSSRKVNILTSKIYNLYCASVCPTVPEEYSRALALHWPITFLPDVIVSGAEPLVELKSEYRVIVL